MHNSENIIKVTELYTSDGWVIWNLYYILIKLLKIEVTIIFNLWQPINCGCWTFLQNTTGFSICLFLCLLGNFQLLQIVVSRTEKVSATLLTSTFLVFSYSCGISVTYYVGHLKFETNSLHTILAVPYTP